MGFEAEFTGDTVEGIARNYRIDALVDDGQLLSRFDQLVVQIIPSLQVVDADFEALGQIPECVAGLYGVDVAAYAVGDGRDREPVRLPQARDARDPRHVPRRQRGAQQGLRGRLREAFGQVAQRALPRSALHDARQVLDPRALRRPGCGAHAAPGLCAVALVAGAGELLRGRGRVAVEFRQRSRLQPVR